MLFVPYKRNCHATHTANPGQAFESDAIGRSETYSLDHILIYIVCNSLLVQ